MGCFLEDLIVYIVLMRYVCLSVHKRQDSVVKGGVLIVHHVHDGKHQYKVDNVKYKRVCDKAFVR